MRVVADETGTRWNACESIVALLFLSRYACNGLARIPSRATGPRRNEPVNTIAAGLKLTIDIVGTKSRVRYWLRGV
jgi:hypothetical protein